MILYHGSFVEVRKPDLLHTRADVDFGRGFYTTPIREQAINWCGKFKRRRQNAFVSIYELDETAFDRLKVLSFEFYSEEWLDFVLACRSCKDVSDYDIVIGNVADDKVFNTVELYYDNLIDKSEAIKRLRYEKSNLQLCLKTQVALDDYLYFRGSEQL